MADPTSNGASGAAQAGLLLAAFGMINSAVGSYYSSKSQASSLQFQSDMATINARMAETSAQHELFRGQQQVAAQTMKAGHLKSAQRAAMAANGIDLGEGNAAEVQASTDLVKEIDSNVIEANAVRSAWGYRTQSVNYANESLIKSATGSSISPGGSAYASMMGSAGNVAQAWYQYEKSK